MNKTSIIKYVARILQRGTLFMVVGATAIYWMMLISITVTIAFNGQLKDSKISSPDSLNETIRVAENLQSAVALRWGVVAIIVSLGLLFIRNYRKYEKGMVVDGVVISILCLLSIVFAEIIIRSFLLHLSV